MNTFCYNDCITAQYERVRSMLEMMAGLNAQYSSLTRNTRRETVRAGAPYNMDGDLYRFGDLFDLPVNLVLYFQLILTSNASCFCLVIAMKLRNFVENEELHLASNVYVYGNFYFRQNSIKND